MLASALAVAVSLWVVPRWGGASAGWEAIRARGVLVVGVPLWLPPFGAPSPAGPWQGLDVALARHLAAQVLGSPTRLRLLPLAADDRLWALGHGEVDAVAAAFAGPAVPAPNALQGVQMIGPYFTEPLVLVVRRGAWVRGAARLDGEVVGVLAGGRAAAALRLAMGARRAAVHEVGSAALAAAEVATGRLRALVVGRSVARALAAHDPELAVQALGGLGNESYWLLVPSGDSELAAAARRAIAALPRGRTLAARMRAWSRSVASPWPGAA